MTDWDNHVLLNILPWKEGAVTTLASIAGYRADAESLLTPKEREIERGLLTDARRLSFVGGRTMAKICVARLIGHDSLQGIQITRQNQGALEINVESEIVDDICVSLSHGGDYVWAAATRGCRIGIDVEAVGPRLFRNQETFASDREQELIGQTVNSDDFDTAYTQLFSAKEAAAKYLGTHMYHAFYHLRLVQMTHSDVVLENRELAKRLYIGSFITKGHVFSRVIG